MEQSQLRRHLGGRASGMGFLYFLSHLARGMLLHLQNCWFALFSSFLSLYIVELEKKSQATHLHLAMKELIIIRNLYWKCRIPIVITFSACPSVCLSLRLATLVVWRDNLKQFFTVLPWFHIYHIIMLSIITLADLRSKLFEDRIV